MLIRRSKRTRHRIQYGQEIKNATIIVKTSADDRQHHAANLSDLPRRQIATEQRRGADNRQLRTIDWSKIDNGDKTVRIGRSFLSHVNVPLTDQDTQRLRFTVTSPPNTGILIDDIRLAPATPLQRRISAANIASAGRYGDNRVAKVEGRNNGFA